MSRIQQKKGKKKVLGQRTDRLLLAMAFILIGIAWVLGAHREEADLAPYLSETLPQADRIEYFTNSTYKAFSANDSLLGYITIKSAFGYGGPLNAAVAVNLRGEVIGCEVVSNKETPSYIDKVLASPLQQSLHEKPYTDTYEIGRDLDGVSGATFSSRALAASTKRGVRYVSVKFLKLPTPPESKFHIQFGLIEMILVLLFGMGYMGQSKTFKYKKHIRWLTMITGLIFLGFIYNQPFTLSHVSQLLLGYFPDFESHLFWYLLLGGMFFVFTMDNKNPYCQWFCPFGAAQECIGVIGGAKNRPMGGYSDILKWIQRSLTLSAILLALYFRNPGLTSFEVFGTLFSLTGSNYQFAILGIVLITSLFVKRPWCKFLCPLKPSMDAYSNLRKWVMEFWKKKQQKPVAPAR